MDIHVVCDKMIGLSKPCGRLSECEDIDQALGICVA